MNEFVVGFCQGFRRGIWRWFALPAAVVTAVVRTVFTLGFEDDDSLETPTKKS
jgi:hypothetical protein